MYTAFDESDLMGKTVVMEPICFHSSRNQTHDRGSLLTFFICFFNPHTTIAIWWIHPDNAFPIKDKCVFPFFVILSALMVPEACTCIKVESEFFMKLIE
jgi:hypothetical protein